MLHNFTQFQSPMPVFQFSCWQLPTHFAKTGHIFLYFHKLYRHTHETVTEGLLYFFTIPFIYYF